MNQWLNEWMMMMMGSIKPTRLYYYVLLRSCSHVTMRKPDAAVIGAGAVPFSSASAEIMTSLPARLNSRRLRSSGTPAAQHLHQRQQQQLTPLRWMNFFQHCIYRNHCRRCRVDKVDAIILRPHGLEINRKTTLMAVSSSEIQIIITSTCNDVLLEQRKPFTYLAMVLSLLIQQNALISDVFFEGAEQDKASFG